MYTLFLDDIRNPTWDLRADGQEIIVCRTCAEAEKVVLSYGLPHTISFDHDLGKNQPVAMAFLWWLIDADLEQQYDLKQIQRIIIHSQNPVGAENLRGLWDGYATSILKVDVRAEMRMRNDSR